MTTTEPEAPPVPDHPAQFSQALLALLGRMLTEEAKARGAIRVLDPFAGAGGIHKLAQEGVETFGVELQPEWARVGDTICGSALELPELFPGPPPFDALCTSPCYGNRMADHHQAEERCTPCAATGRLVVDGHEQECEPCAGSGRRDHHRNTYAHALRRSGAEPVASDDNAQLMQWGPRYRSFHEAAWRSADRVLRPGGLVLLNVKNHVRGKEVQRVAEFHLNIWLLLGYLVQEAKPVPTRGLAYGANYDARVEAELVLALRKPL